MDICGDMRKRALFTNFYDAWLDLAGLIYINPAICPPPPVFDYIV